MKISLIQQPAKKKARRQVRQEKAAKMAPRPTQLLRPAVHCPTVKVRSCSSSKLFFLSLECLVFACAVHLVRATAVLYPCCVNLKSVGNIYSWARQTHDRFARNDGDLSVRADTLLICVM